MPLNELVKERRMEEAQIIKLMLQLCDTLIYLHGQTPAVIHRDIKPQNIIVDEAGKIKLIDFGISRLYDKSAHNDTVFIGTQEFAPPEQYGFSQTDERSDIFSLGVVLCWLLTGETDTSKARVSIHNRRLSTIIKKWYRFRSPGSICRRQKLTQGLGGRRRPQKKEAGSHRLCRNIPAFRLINRLYRGQVYRYRIASFSTMQTL